MRNGEIQTQIIPPAGKQPGAKQSKLKPDTDRLHVPTRIRAAQRKIRKRAMRGEKRHEGQISQLAGKTADKENCPPGNAEANHPKKSRSTRGKEKEQEATEQENPIKNTSNRNRMQPNRDAGA